jgi:hypothetical protein
MSVDTIISIAGFAVTVIGLFLIFYQVSAARKDTMTGSFISSISEHWKSIEERRLQLRSGEPPAYYPTMFPYLEELYKKEKYKSDLRALAKDYLYEYDNANRLDKKAIFQAIANEYAYQDIVFNLYEEEYIAAWELNLVNKKLKGYWLWYMKETFEKSNVTRHHWELRQVVGRTSPLFVKFVEKELIPIKASVE